MFSKIKSFLFENRTAKQTIAKNSIWLTISNFGGRFIKAIVIIYAARVLGTAGWGVLSYAITLAGFFTFLIDPGVNSIVLRDVPKAEGEKKLNILSTAFVIKLFLIAIAAIVIIVAGDALSTLPGAKALLPIVILIFAFDTMREFFSSFIRAKEKMEWEAGIFLLTNLAIMVTGFVFLAYSQTAKAFGWAYVIGTALGALVAAFILRDELKNMFSHFSRSLIAPILRSAWPFAITGALGILLTNTDILIISWMRSASEVGIYSAAIRIAQVLYLVPIILQYSTLPSLSRLAKNDDARFRHVLEITLSVIFLAAVPMGIGGAILGEPIMRFVFGDAYAPGGLAFTILMLTLIFDYPAIIMSTAIFAYDRQRNLIISSAIGGVANVALDLLLIPPFGITGSAVATLIAQFMSSAYLWYTMKKINYFAVVPLLKKIMTAGIVMGIAAVAMSALHVHVAINILVCIAVYFLVLKSFREPLLSNLAAILRGGAADGQASHEPDAQYSRG